MTVRSRFFIFAFACAFALALLAGCSSSAPTEDAGGLPGQSTENTPNQVNPSLIPDSSFIYDASIADLVNADSYMDDQTVQVVGEVVGDRIVSDYDDGHCWIVLQADDGTYSQVSVYMTFSQSRAIDTYGVYGKRGTKLQVRGTFNLACDDHDGLSDIHATAVSVVAKGETVERTFNFVSFLPGIFLVLCGGALVLLYRYLGERRR